MGIESSDDALRAAQLAHDLRQNGPAGAIAVRPQRLGNHEPRRLFFATPPAEGGVRKTPSPVWRQ